MPRKKSAEKSVSTPTSELAQALVEAIQITKPKQKVLIGEYDPKTPWSPPPGVMKARLKRTMYNHGILWDEEKLSNETIELLNKVKPGIYCDGWIKVIRRRDKGIDIDWPCKTHNQRLQLVTRFGFRNLNEILNGIIAEAKAPKKVEADDLD